MAPLLALVLAIAVLRASACRWAIYAGKEAKSGDQLFTSPEHALARQSYAEPAFKEEATKALHFDEDKFYLRNHRINKDGWGLGWYSTETGHAERHRDAQGATDENHVTNPALVGVVEGIRSQVLLAHVRAGTSGAANNCSNSHPFQFRQLLWMHNGCIPQDALNRLEDLIECSEVRDLVRGETDSEHLGGYFASSLDGDGGACSRDKFSLAELRRAMKNTLHVVEKLEAAKPASSLNLAVSDGKHVVVTRYRTKRDEDPPSMYYARTTKAVWIASEPLDAEMNSVYKGEPRIWLPLAKDEMLSYDVDSDALEFECLSETCELDREHRGRTSAEEL